MCGPAQFQQSRATACHPDPLPPRGNRYGPLVEAPEDLQAAEPKTIAGKDENLLEILPAKEAKRVDHVIV
jgi:hypothetical protein